MTAVRVLLVNSHGSDVTRGGAERYVRELSVGLARAGVECDVLSAFAAIGEPEAVGAVLRPGHDPSHRIRRIAHHAGAWTAMAGVRLRTAIAGFAPDVVHTHNLHGITTGVWECARRMDVPVVHTLHDYGLVCPRTTLLRRDGTPCCPHPLICGARARRLLRWAPAVSCLIGVSRHVLDFHADLFGQGVARDVIRAPAPAPAAAPAPGAELLTLGFAGRLDVHKGVPELLGAAPELRARGIRVRIAGDGPLREAVAACAAVDYAGHLSAAGLTDFHAGCDAGVVPSRWDEPGVSFAALEWLAAGRPVLATRRGGLVELPEAAVVWIGSAGPGAIVESVLSLRGGSRWDELRAAAGDADAALGDDLRRFAGRHLEIYARVRA